MNTEQMLAIATMFDNIQQFQLDIVDLKNYKQQSELAIRGLMQTNAELTEEIKKLKATATMSPDPTKTGWVAPSVGFSAGASAATTSLFSAVAPAVAPAVVPAVAPAATTTSMFSAPTTSMFSAGAAAPATTTNNLFSNTMPAAGLASGSMFSKPAGTGTSALGFAQPSFGNTTNSSSTTPSMFGATTSMFGTTPAPAPAQNNWAMPGAPVAVQSNSLFTAVRKK